MAKNIRRTFAEVFELPAEAVCALPVITLTGQVDMIIENYGGILEYSDGKITLNTSAGILKIEGSTLDIKYMNSQCISIKGAISSFSYEK
ncbi:sporulation protein YqfC [Lachnospiraceae bacterium NSJ-143]|nr:sporulation protein YqfC [Lachnospiraceae bacterium NSJ-143]